MDVVQLKGYQYIFHVIGENMDVLGEKDGDGEDSPNLITIPFPLQKSPATMRSERRASSSLSSPSTNCATRGSV